jgi:hypothetical protein
MERVARCRRFIGGFDGRGSNSNQIPAGKWLPRSGPSAEGSETKKRPEVLSISRKPQGIIESFELQATALPYAWHATNLQAPPRAKPDGEPPAPAGLFLKGA